jgi:hypothetical protein
MENGGGAPHICDLGTRLKEGAHFTLQLLHRSDFPVLIRVSAGNGHLFSNLTRTYLQVVFRPFILGAQVKRLKRKPHRSCPASTELGI